MPDIEARLVQLRDEQHLPIVPRVSSQGVIMSDGTTLETYIDNHTGEVGKLQHSLTIGDKVFDGTADVVVEVYDGEISDTLNNTRVMQMQPADNMTNINSLHQMTTS